MKVEFKKRKKAENSVNQIKEYMTNIKFYTAKYQTIYILQKALRNYF